MRERYEKRKEKLVPKKRGGREETSASRRRDVVRVLRDDQWWSRKQIEREADRVGRFGEEWCSAIIIDDDGRRI